MKLYFIGHLCSGIEGRDCQLNVYHCLALDTRSHADTSQIGQCVRES